MEDGGATPVEPTIGGGDAAAAAPDAASPSPGQDAGAAPTNAFSGAPPSVAQLPRSGVYEIEPHT